MNGPAVPLGRAGPFRAPEVIRVTTHDERRAVQIRSVHLRTRRGRRNVCSACGQSWPCTDYSWATGEPTRRWTRRDWARVAAAVVVIVLLPGGLTYRLLPTWGWLLLLCVFPFAAVGILAVASRRRSR